MRDPAPLVPFADSGLDAVVSYAGEGEDELERRREGEEEEEEEQYQ